MSPQTGGGKRSPTSFVAVSRCESVKIDMLYVRRGLTPLQAEHIESLAAFHALGSEVIFLYHSGV